MLIPSRIEGSTVRPPTRRTLAIWSGFLLPLACGGAFAQNDGTDDVPVLDVPTKAEFLDQQERISGGATVGVVFYAPSDAVRLKAAYVYLDDTASSNLEMHLATVDGRYLATFDIPERAGIRGWVRLNLSLSRPDFLDNYTVDEIALLITDADTGVAYPVRWGEGAEADFVRVYINSEGARSYFASYDPVTGRPTAQSCTSASEKSSFKFDRICDVPVADIFDRSRIEIVRKRGAGFGNPIDITVSLPPPRNSE